MARKYDPDIPGIYAIHNTKTGWAYIGKASRIGRRWDYHKNQLRRGLHFNKYLQSSWKKHGEAVFEFEVMRNLEECHKDLLKKYLNLAEAEVLMLFVGRSYNFTVGGDGGVVPGPETRITMGASQKRRFARPHEQARKSAAAKEMFDRDNGKLRLEMSARTTEKNAVRWADPKNHEKQSIKSKEAQSSQEYRDRHAGIIADTWKDETTRENRLIGIRGAWDDPIKRATRLEKGRLTRERNRKPKEEQNL